MKIIPSVNCGDAACFISRARATSQFSDWMHIDISDGKFTGHKSFGSPQDAAGLKKNEVPARIKKEAHFMVKTPAEHIRAWAGVGINRAVIHIESVSAIDEVVSICRALGIEIMLALNPETTVDNIEPLLEQYGISFVQILAVRPGPSGQGFMPEVLSKIKILKENHPEVVVEVDGGITLRTARLAKEAGADIAVSASYIFESKHPKGAFDALSRASYS